MKFRFLFNSVFMLPFVSVSLPLSVIFNLYQDFIVCVGRINLKEIVFESELTFSVNRHVNPQTD